MAYPVMPLGFLGSQGDNDTYRIERSLRFNSADSAYLNRTPASAGNRKTWTWSGWVKRSAITSASTAYTIFSGYTASTDAGFFTIYFFQDGIRISGFNTFWRITNQVFRDPSAWYHLVLSIDTTQVTASNRIRLYLNGSEITSFSTLNNPNQNDDLGINHASSHGVGYSAFNSSDHFNGYLTEIHFIDGQALTPSSFGETDPITGRWKAKAYSGTYGTNGFYLKFADNSGTTSTTLGKDSSGNGNNWTPNNFSVTAGAGNDSLVDSPTNYGTDTGVGGEVRGNYATLNPLDIGPTSALANGNLDFSTSSSPNYSICRSTIGVSSGKWYWEILVNSSATANMVGVANSSATLSQYLGQNANGWGYYSDGQKYNNGSGSAYGASFTTNDVIGVALDMDAGTVVFYKNNSSQGTAFSGLSGTLFPTVSDASSASSANLICNFGQRPFAYTAPSGFKALCTTNLPQPTIQKPSSAMDVVTYTGNGSARSITGLGFSPDLVWIKGRSGATDHAIYDSVRGVQKDLGSNLTTDETTQTQGLTAFNSDGFDIGTLAKINTNTSTYVAWAWDRAAIDGLDIVSYTGNGANRTISHNLGVAPKMIIVKARTTAGSDQGWPVYHASNTAAPETDYLLLNSTAATADLDTVWNDTAPTASVFSVGTNALVNTNNDTYIAYVFAEVEGFSKFGSYTGNGSADGPFVWCGFRPRWILIKSSSSTTDWLIYDSARDQFNVTNLNLRPNLADAESTQTANYLDLTSNGFKIRGTSLGSINASQTYIFAAFAESPFKYSRAR